MTVGVYVGPELRRKEFIHARLRSTRRRLMSRVLLLSLLPLLLLLLLRLLLLMLPGRWQSLIYSIFISLRSQVLLLHLSLFSLFSLFFILRLIMMNSICL